MAYGISIAKSSTEVDGRVLQAPKLKAGNGEDIFTRNGRWNFNNKVSMFRVSYCLYADLHGVNTDSFEILFPRDSDGVGESQFSQMLNIELDQIIEACKFLDENWDPKFTLIVAQKNHHTKFFIPGAPDNVPPGTVVDNKVCHLRNYDFYMCSHAGMIGITRPTHYHILHDEIGFNPDDLQELVHSLSYV
ncbi:protein argonaute 4B-like [Panicum hallii]|uniref:protein argonaute 4B-like n=1 Tax=Panicum hallii TaxID=206008 RepID=UPI000DF4E43D|nr:protein argonaute 4B-like [Panicum hallii]